jgi:hypothetical protein
MARVGTLGAIKRRNRAKQLTPLHGIDAHELWEDPGIVRQRGWSRFGLISHLTSTAKCNLCIFTMARVGTLGAIKRRNRAKQPTPLHGIDAHKLWEDPGIIRQRGWSRFGLISHLTSTAKCNLCIFTMARVGTLGAIKRRNRAKQPTPLHGIDAHKLWEDPGIIRQRGWSRFGLISHLTSTAKCNLCIFTMARVGTLGAIKRRNRAKQPTPLHGIDAHKLWEDPGIIRQRGWSRFGLISHLTSTAKCNLCIFTMARVGTLGAIKRRNRAKQPTPLHGIDAHELWEDPGIIRQRGWSRFGLISHLTSTAKCNLCIFTMARVGTLGAIKRRNRAKQPTPLHGIDAHKLWEDPGIIRQRGWSRFGLTSHLTSTAKCNLCIFTMARVGTLGAIKRRNRAKQPTPLHGIDAHKLWEDPGIIRQRGWSRFGLISHLTSTAKCNLCIFTMARVGTLGAIKRRNRAKQPTPLHGIDAHELWEDPGIIRQRGWSRFGLISHLTSTAKCNLCIFTMARVGTLGAIKRRNRAKQPTPLHGIDAHKLWEDPGIIRQRGWSRFGLISHLTSTAKCNLCIFTMARVGTLGAIKRRNRAKQPTPLHGIDAHKLWEDPGIIRQRGWSRFGLTSHLTSTAKCNLCIFTMARVGTLGAIKRRNRAKQNNTESMFMSYGKTLESSATTQSQFMHIYHKLVGTLGAIKRRNRAKQPARNRCS